MRPSNDRAVLPQTALGAEARLAARARQVLRHNDMGDWTRLSPNLYPHQWSRDSAFIAFGLAHLSIRRAARELLAPFEHQWGTGKVPHWFSIRRPRREATYLVLSTGRAPRILPEAPPAPPYTGRRRLSPRSTPSPPCASWEVAERNGGGGIDEARALLREIYPKLLVWHRYLMTCRDPLQGP